jgi:hypothetical protein
LSKPWKPDKGLPILEFFAWIATESDGGQGLIAIEMPNGRTMPLVGADRERIESLRSVAMETVKRTGCPVELVRFHGREVLERHVAPPETPL